VKVVAMLLRFWSYLFALLFGLFLSGVALVLLISGSKNFRFTQMPYWEGSTALYGLLAIGVLGVLSAVLAALKGIRPLLLVWTLCLFALLVYGYFINIRHFFVFGAAEAKSAAWLSFGALGAFVGALMQYRTGRRA
jgi:hypothetical protein